MLEGKFRQVVAFCLELCCIAMSGCSIAMFYQWFTLLPGDPAANRPLTLAVITAAMAMVTFSATMKDKAWRRSDGRKAVEDRVSKFPASR